MQFCTYHLERLGAFEVARDDYLDRLEAATAVAVDLSRLRPAVD